ncbi:MAG: nucleotidyl transferase AbiEii/AbiGii toxin family protein [Bacteroidetes bacterium]|nr:nucleotidyl transferase AbiEii/AbiGii toxin family protein [Bacteroidota bacterium]
MGLLKELLTLKELKQFRLVGGTALSLLLGHRSSIDLDLFTDRPFDFDEISFALSNKFQSFSAKEKKSSRLLFTTINNVKIDFVYTFEPFNYPDQTIEGIRFAAIEEIIALKLNGISGRGAKKDFWDVHELLEHYSFENMMEFYQKRYTANSPMMVLKSITYFADADEDDDPYCLKGHKWPEIKKNIIKKFNTYIKNIS